MNGQEKAEAERTCPWLLLDLSVSEWWELTEWAEEFVGQELSRHEVYMVANSMFGGIFVLKMKLLALVRATRVKPQLVRLLGVARG